MGDFNATLRDHERQGGSTSTNRRGDNAFRECFSECRLLDIGFQGTPFTWKRGAVCERLDRCLASYDWRLAFPETNLIHLSPLKSDHCPILLEFDCRRHVRRDRRPFRFQAAWLTHAGLKDVVRAQWAQGMDWNSRIAHLTQSLQDWNRNVFGNIFYEKRRLLRRLNGIARKLTHEVNPFLEDLQCRLWKDYETILTREELLWFQKSRCKWIKYGDKNTKLFHGTTIARRRRNHVTMLQNEDGVWVTDKGELEHMVTRYYKELFTESCECAPFSLSGNFPLVDEQSCQSLGDPIDDGEILRAVRRMDGYKAPGSDGLQAIFYQTQWDVVGASICSLIHGFESNPTTISCVNDTLITLIPKVENVEMLKHMRPISLCNVSYKILSKILATRLRNVMGKLVGPNQCSFVPNRQMRQGDPISPYIFVLCMERLFHLIEIAVNHQLWKPIRISRGGPKIAHLAFADDLLLFAEASVDQVEIIQTCLDLFCSSSGQKVSQDKTRIHFSKNVSWRVREEISNKFGFLRTDNLGKYLGVPIHHRRVNRVLFKGVVEKVNQRLSSWKAKTLSFAGRVTLTQSVLSALPSYLMQSVYLPRQVCDELDKHYRRFLWDDKENKHRLHAVSWEVISKPRLEGGLNIRSTRHMNSLFMMKNCWEFITQPDKLWVKVLNAKYKCGTARIPRVTAKKSASNVWRGMCSVWSMVSQNIIWRIGDGNHVRFWLDHWVPNIPCLADRATQPIPLVEKYKVVADYITDQGDWRMHDINHFLPMEVCAIIEGLVPPSIGEDDDAIAWIDSPTGEFNMRSAYSMLRGNGDNHTHQVYRDIARWQAPERLRMFLWRVAQDSLVTNSFRLYRGLTECAICPLCHAGLETAMHILRDCHLVTRVWNVLLQGHLIPEFFRYASACDWILANLSYGCHSEPNWGILFAVAVDAFWYWRNKVVFGEIEGDISQLVFQIKGRTNEIIRVGFGGRPRGISHAAIQQRTIRWYPPPRDSCKLNCDGAVSYGIASCGGVARDHNGNFIMAFSCKLGNCSVVQAELWAIFYGIKLLRERSWSGAICVETDSAVAVKLLKEGCIRTHDSYSLVNKIVHIVGDDHEVSCSHIFREANQVADLLAKHGRSLQNRIVIFSDPPSWIHFALLADLSAVAFFRGF
uniref:Ribonuclease H protein At1g65750 family n=1 Tax=Cajanus cajan TaxID=3821 RepID=A0A151SNW8_CAJCA|nr:Putative ribonuclease H protein At1g65750 family [Cajanus cajan]